jgi:hypothetical protein
MAKTSDWMPVPRTESMAMCRNWIAYLTVELSRPGLKLANGGLKTSGAAGPTANETSPIVHRKGPFLSRL